MAVSKRSDRGDSWWLDYYYQGKRHRQKIGGTKRKAEDAMADIRSRIAAGTFVSPDERKQEEALVVPQAALFEDFVGEEYLPWSEVNHSAKHHSLQESIVRVQLKPFLGGRYLHEITPKLLDDYVTQRLRKRVLRGKRKRQVKEATVNRDIACLKVLFRKAVEWGKLEESPAKGLKAFKEIPNPPRLLEVDEVARLLEEMPDHLKALIGCAVYAGLRKQELLQLRWDDISMKTGDLRAVSRQEHHTKNRETRRIPMNEPLKQMLQRHPRRLGSVYVFCNRDGMPYDNVRAALSSAALRAGIDDGVGMHQLRHAFCSHGLMMGVDPRTMQKWMGHKDLATTLQYAHVSPDHEKAAIQRLRYDHGHQAVTKVEGT